jgi:hypothetical protein
MPNIPHKLYTTIDALSFDFQGDTTKMLSFIMEHPNMVTKSVWRQVRDKSLHEVNSLISSIQHREVVQQ